MKVNRLILGSSIGILLILGVIVIANMSIAGSMFYPQQSGVTDIFTTPDQNNLTIANKAVKEFTGNNNINVSFDYKIDRDDGNINVVRSGEEFYYVNELTGFLEGFAKPSNVQIGTSVKLNKTQAFNIAAEYLKKHYSQISVLNNLTVTRSELIDHGVGGKEYVFTWSEIINGVDTSNNVFMSVNPNDGSINLYMAKKYQPALISTVPTISKEAALEIASEKYPGTNMTNYTARLYVKTIKDDQQLLWDINVPSTITNYNTGVPLPVVSENSTPTTLYIVYGGIVTVDAKTGNIIHVNPVV